VSKLMQSRIKLWQVSTYYLAHSKAGHMTQIRRCVKKKRRETFL